MLTFYKGTRTDLLADRLIGLYETRPLSDPLEQERVVVQNHGMAQWLSKRIARISGVAGNYAFEFPAERIWSLYRTLDPDIPKALPSDREPMSWALFDLLRELPEREPFIPVWGYMRDSEGAWSPRKAWKLANRIGDLFDQYLVYRPGMMLRWGGRDQVPDGERWQAELWRMLLARWRTRSHGDILHRPAIHRRFLQELRGGEFDPSVLPERLSLFGLSGLPPDFIELFVEISQWVDLHWFWMEPEYGSLSESWGGEGQDFFELFSATCKSAGISPDIQLLGNATSASGDGVPDLFDQPAEDDPPAITIHSCHSPLREVEVLYDRLVALFDEDPDLEPEDILVITPDIRTYAPFIEAVFGNTESGLPEIPYFVLDDPKGTRKEAYETFTKFLELLQSRFKVSDLLDLLSSPMLREKLHLSEEHIDRLHTWVEGTHIHWGISAEEKARLGVPGSPQFTWRHGLDRMMLGFAAEAGDELFEGIYPYGTLEGSDDAELLGKFSRFITTLLDMVPKCRAAQDAGRWADLLRSWIEALVPVTQEYQPALQGLLGLVQQMEEDTAMGGMQGTVTYEVLLDYLDNKLEGAASRGGYFGHGVAFSGLDQMRLIPFRVIAMIGMNNEAFPRSKVTPEFDLMVRYPRKGDRSRRDDDRYLFLETLQSAGDLFYLSYTGQSDRDDRSRPPSVTVSELADWIADRTGSDRTKLVSRHPLHAYSRAYFEKDAEDHLFTYSEGRYRVSRQVAEGRGAPVPLLGWEDRLPPADKAYRQLSVSDLASFFLNPARFLLQNRLGVRYREQDEAGEDREPFELGGLLSYQLGDELLDRELEGRSADRFKAIARASGLLPEGWPGEEAFDRLRGEVAEIGRQAGRLTGSAQHDRLEVSLELGDFHLGGRLEHLFGDTQLFLRYGKIHPRFELKLWIYHLVFLLTGDGNGKSYIMGREKGDLVTAAFADVANARERLEELLELYWRGLHGLLPHFPKTSRAFASAYHEKGKPVEGALASALEAWNPSYNPEFSESRDFYNTMLYQGLNLFERQEFIDISSTVWKPLLSAMRSGEVNDG